jgi:hypothetical protein
MTPTVVTIEVALLITISSHTGIGSGSGEGLSVALLVLETIGVQVDDGFGELDILGEVDVGFGGLDILGEVDVGFGGLDILGEGDIPGEGLEDADCDGYGAAAGVVLAEYVGDGVGAGLITRSWLLAGAYRAPLLPMASDPSANAALFGFRHCHKSDPVNPSNASSVPHANGSTYTTPLASVVIEAGTAHGRGNI